MNRLLTGHCHEQRDARVARPGIDLRSKWTAVASASAATAGLASTAGSAKGIAQTPPPAKCRVCMDVGHRQRFWRDPADMPGMDVKMIERVRYMTGELVDNFRNGSSVTHVSLRPSRRASMRAGWARTASAPASPDNPARLARRATRSLIQTSACAGIARGPATVHA